MLPRRAVSVPAVVATRSLPIVQFMLELAAALNRAGESVALNQARMQRVAKAYDVTGARVAVLPNMVLAAGGRGVPAALEFSHLDPTGHRLDQTAAIADLASQAERAAIDPDDGLRRLDEIAVMRHRFGAAGVIGGHMVLTIGLALILQPTPEALGTAAGFGALIGALKLYASHRQTVSVLLPLLAATLVSALAFGFQPDKTIDGSMRVLIPCLVTFLPGSLLTTATLDLAAGEVISGSSRLVAGTMQLVLLELRPRRGGPDRRGLTRQGDHQRGAEHARRLGAVARRPRVRHRLLRALLRTAPRARLAPSRALLGPTSVNSSAAGSSPSRSAAFFGGLIVTPVAAWVQTRPSGPPALATFLPAFWLLVPGAVGLIGVAEFVGSDRAAGLDHFVHAITTFVSIGVGVLVGNAIVLRFSSAARPSMSPR